MKQLKFALALGLLATSLASAQNAQQSNNKKNKKEPQKTALDEYVEQAHKRAEAEAMANPGSLFASSNGGTLADMAMDVRARRVDDIITIVVSEQASAVSTGQTKTSRASAAQSAISSGLIKGNAAAALANLVNTNTNTSLDGEGTTSRTTTLNTALSARVVDVLPNGYLVVEGNKTLNVNSENQSITLRGVVRPADLSNSNIVMSESVAQMELKINGKGVVNDAIRRPNFLYRLLMGILPF